MENINKIELSGRCGLAHVQEVNGSTYVRFSLGVEHGAHEFMWIQCIYWPEKGENIDRIHKSAHLTVEGRLRCQEYTREDGTTGRSYEVKAYKVY